MVWGSTWTARWRFSDGTETYSFQINPNEADGPFREAPVEAIQTTDNQVLLVQGTKTPKTMTISGVLFDPSQYDAFVNWLRKKRRVFMYDHWDRQYTVVVLSFQPKPRKTTRTHPFAHDYTMTIMVLKEPE